MSRKPRDYRTEYRRRIARGKLKGLSIAQARGHRLANERAVGRSPPRPLDEQTLQVALQELRRQGSIYKAAKSIRVSKERLRRIALEQGVIERGAGKRWKITEGIPRIFQIFEEGKGALVEVALNTSEASKAGQYMAEVRKLFGTNRVVVLKPFQGQGVTDLKGKFHPFETDPNRLFKLSATGNPAFENIYRIQL